MRTLAAICVLCAIVCTILGVLIPSQWLMFVAAYNATCGLVLWNGR